MYSRMLYTTTITSKRKIGTKKNKKKTKKTKKNKTKKK